MMALRDITMDDLKDKLHMKGTGLDFLCAVAARATEIYKNERNAAPETIDKARKPIICVLKMPRKRPSVTNFSDDAGFSAPDPASKRRRVPYPSMAEMPPLPAEFITAIEEMGRARNVAPTPPKLVIQKELYETDLSSGHNRLSIPFNKIADDFLTEGEKQHLLLHDESKKKNYLDVLMVEPSLEEETVKLCRWDMPKEKGKTSSTYVIRGNWSAVVKKNKLRVGMTVQLWCFRLDQELCFALVRLPRNRAV